MTARDAMSSLRDLQPGEFYAFGPALTRMVTKFQIGTVQTTHPKVGDRLSIRTPSPSRKVLGILQELADIPKSAEEEAVTVESLRAENTSLKRQLGAAKVVRQGPSDEEVAARIEKATAYVRAGYEKTLQSIASLVGKSVSAHPSEHRIPAVLPVKQMPNQRRVSPLAAINASVTQPQQGVLDAMAKLEALGLSDLHKTQVAAMAAASPNSGSYANNLGRLRTAGLIDYPQGGYVAFTDAGRDTANPVTAMPTLEDLHEAWLGILTQLQQRILRETIAEYPNPIPKTDLARRIDVSPDSGSYANNLGRLRTLGAIDYPRPGYVKAMDVLFPVSGKAA